MKTFSVRCRYDDRKRGPEGRTLQIQATNISGAIGKAAREFGLDRKQRFDAAKGLRIEATRVRKLAEGEDI